MSIDKSDKRNSQKPQPKKEGIRNKVGTIIEKAGHKLAEAGAPGLGQKVHDLGDKIEKTHSNPNHSHKV
jgi:hypothetical protein